VGGRHVACFPPRQNAGDGKLLLERYAEKDQHVEAAVRFLAVVPGTPHSALRTPRSHDLVLLTNGRGGMARLCVDLGKVNSKYDCALGANLNAEFPVDRHVFAKRLRVWINADGFVTPLNFQNLASFEIGPPAVWNFMAEAGDG